MGDFGNLEYNGKESEMRDRTVAECKGTLRWHHTAVAGKRCLGGDNFLAEGLAGFDSTAAIADAIAAD